MKTFELIRFAHGTHLQRVMEVALQEFPVVFDHVSGRETGEPWRVSADRSCSSAGLAKSFTLRQRKLLELEMSFGNEMLAVTSYRHKSLH